MDVWKFNIVLRGRIVFSVDWTVNSVDWIGFGRIACLKYSPFLKFIRIDSAYVKYGRFVGNSNQTSLKGNKAEQ